MALFLTGDTHADFGRFRKGEYSELDCLSKEDYVLICGDFGGIWDNSSREKYWLAWLNERPFTTLFVSGNHENYDRLQKFPVSRWHGGDVQYIRSSIIHLMRGQIFDIDGKQIFTMGGASSHDVQDGILELDDPKLKQKIKMLTARRAFFRINHLSWWKEELPSAEEYATARANLDRVNWSVDYIVTHCAPTSIQNLFGMYQPDALTGFLEEVRQKCQFRDWFFGHYHDNKMIGDQFILLYKQIVQLK